MHTLKNHQEIRCCYPKILRRNFERIKLQQLRSSIYNDCDRIQLQHAGNPIYNQELEMNIYL